MRSPFRIQKRLRPQQDRGSILRYRSKNDSKRKESVKIKNTIIRFHIREYVLTFLVSDIEGEREREGAFCVRSWEKRGREPSDTNRIVYGLYGHEHGLLFKKNKNF